MPGYYTERLAAERLRACYDLAPPRTKAYLEAEVEFVLAKTTPSILALELGCGYGRVLERLLPRVRVAFGIDTSPSSLRMALDYLGRNPSLRLTCMDSVQMGFRDHAFDLTLCIQNGICAFAVDQQQLLREAIRVTRSGGLVMFSSYTSEFWEHRLEWFEIQSAHHLIGEIDYQATGNGMIVCKDGFRATTADRATFEKLAAPLGLTAQNRLEPSTSVTFRVTVHHRFLCLNLCSNTREDCGTALPITVSL
jgi:SAM-dependent methyltransferase